MQASIRAWVIPVLLLLPSFPAALASASSAPREVRKEYDDFLQNLGFEDYSARIGANLDAGKKGVAPGSEQVLRVNQERYRIFNYARDLSVDLMERLEERDGDPRLRKKMIDLAGRMLALQPADGPTQLPPEIASLPEKERQGAAWNYVVNEMEKARRSQVYSVTSDVLDVLIGKEEVRKVLEAVRADPTHLSPETQEKAARIDRIKDLVSKMVTFGYTDVDFGQTRHLGRALAASLERYALIHQDATMVEELGKSAAVHGLMLENFVGDEIRMRGSNGKVQVVKVRNGSFIMELSVGGNQTPWAMRPGWRNYLRAKWANLIGNLTSFVPRSSPTPGGNSFFSWLKDKIATSNFANKGYSHGGVAMVRTDPKTGLKMTWGLDNYPNALPNGQKGPGGIRIVGIPEQFALPGPYLKLGVSSLDPEKYYRQARRQIEKYGYRPVALEAMEKTVDAQGNLIRPEKPVPANWETRISEGDFYHLHRMPAEIKRGPRDARKKWIQQWFDKMMELRTSGMLSMITHDGIGFNDDFTRVGTVFGETYCIQAAYLSDRLNTGLDWVTYPDHFNWLLRAADRLPARYHPSGLPNTRLNLISPNSMAWQPAIGSHRQITFPHMTRTAEGRAFTTAPYVPWDDDLPLLLGEADEKRGLPPGGPGSIDSNLAGRDPALNGDIVKGVRYDLSGTGQIRDLQSLCFRQLLHGLQ